VFARELARVKPFVDSGGAFQKLFAVSFEVAKMKTFARQVRQQTSLLIVNKSDLRDEATTGSCDNGSE
jgi:hypothetical protein